MKQLRWKDFSLVSKIVIEVGMIAVLLFAMNMLFYVRINNSMQKMDNVYASNAELTELSQVFEKVQDNMYKYLKVKSSQTLLDEWHYSSLEANSSASMTGCSPSLSLLTVILTPRAPASN